MSDLLNSSSVSCTRVERDRNSVTARSRSLAGPRSLRSRRHRCVSRPCGAYGVGGRPRRPRPFDPSGKVADPLRAKPRRIGGFLWPAPIAVCRSPYHSRPTSPGESTGVLGASEYLRRLLSKRRCFVRPVRPDALALLIPRRRSRYRSLSHHRRSRRSPPALLRGKTSTLVSQVGKRIWITESSPADR